MTSIWLQLRRCQEQALQSLIDSMAAEHRTVSFRPHLTVCNVPGDLAALDAAAAYIKECGLLPLTVAKTAVTGAVITPFRAVFIEVENSPACVNFASGCAISSAHQRSSRRTSVCSIRSTELASVIGPTWTRRCWRRLRAAALK